jgi:hypothetical protein
MSGMLMEAAVIPTPVKEAVLACFSFNEKERPPIQSLRSVIAIFYRKSSVMEQMLQRFQNYSDKLEQVVMARTEELVLEETKAVALLQEMIPS